jgi:putative tryptophan/tyrosine transport system substrate-binding protein
MSKQKMLLTLAVVVVLIVGFLAFHAPSAPTGTAQKPTVAIFNLLSYPILDASIAGIKAELAAQGFAADKLTVKEINANGEMDKLNAFSQELLSLHPDVIVPVSTPVAQAVIKVSPPTQNIVYSTVTNPSDVGMDNHPRNVTGVSDKVNYEANMLLLLELFPQAKVIGVVYNPGERNSEFGMREIQGVAAARGLKLQSVTVANGGEVQDAARGLLREIDAFYVGSDNTVVGALPALLKVAEEGHKPVIASDSGSVKQGALAAVSVDYEKLGRRVGTIVVSLLKEHKHKEAGDIPNVTFTGDSLVLNRATASRMGYNFPPPVLGRAAQVFDK